MRKIALLLLLAAASLPASDWAFWRGVNQNGVSADKGLPSTWSPEGENLVWKADLGTRSTPIVSHGQVCVIRLAEPDTPSKWQEQVVCVDEKTGKIRWQDRDNVFQTDIPHHRVGWASLVADAETGAIYSHSISGVITGFTKDGKTMWRRSLDEEIGRFSGFGGRTTTPIVDGDLVVVCFLTAGFGPNFIPRHRFYALDKNTGETVWLSTPGQAPYDTTYSTPIVSVINGQRLLIAGNGDGGVYALEMETGEKVWGFPLSKRGLNSAVVEADGVVFASHSEENVDASTAMGRVVAYDAKQVTDGAPKLLWMVDGFQAGYASPVVHDGLLYAVDNSTNLVAFDVKNGEELWREKLGIAQRASPVIGDGKLYVSDVDGQFHIYKLNGRMAPERLDLDVFKNADGSATQINGSPAIANGRVYLPTNNALYAIGLPSGQGVTMKPELPPVEKAPAGAKPAHLQVVPAEVALNPGAKQTFVARTFDDHGRLIGEAAGAEWSLQGLKGSIAGGALALSGENTPQGGVVTVKAGGLEAKSQVRVMPDVPYEDDFNSYELKGFPAGFPAIRGRFEVADKDGEKVLYKSAANLRSQKTRVYFGDPDASAYTIQIDVFGAEKARRMPDVGLISHRYTLDMQGNKQKLMLYTWTSEVNRFSKTVPFKFDPNIWYTMKLRVEPSGDNKPTKVMGKVWKRGEAEPDAWTIEAVDEVGNAKGSPGFYAYALADMYFDNLKVTPNK
ncbi:MAG: PQQ-binding-like beta-propeller repeat protein [Acidobacteria bacterium]|nr:PQQ-binding-like beta-propeller repeat protein [Acidobacteriota bacterium]